MQDRPSIPQQHTQTGPAQAPVFGHKGEKCVVRLTKRKIAAMISVFYNRITIDVFGGPDRSG